MSSAGSWGPRKRRGSWPMTVSTDSSGADPKAEAPSLALRLLPILDRYGILLVILVMGLVLYALQPAVFLSWRNIPNIFKQTAVNSMLAIGMFVVILTYRKSVVEGKRVAVDGRSG